MSAHEPGEWTLTDLRYVCDALYTLYAFSFIFCVCFSGVSALQGVSKSGLFGFCDPCPGAKKQLRIVYEYGGTRSTTTIEDMEGLVLPL